MFLFHHPARGSVHILSYSFSVCHQSWCFCFRHWRCRHGRTLPGEHPGLTNTTLWPWGSSTLHLLHREQSINRREPHNRLFSQSRDSHCSIVYIHPFSLHLRLQTGKHFLGSPDSTRVACRIERIFHVTLGTPECGKISLSLPLALKHRA